ncbi:hypothetical protein LCGC14_1066760 [marine sediment metagenome]|uniref:Uncharacterized protein n=1 Tax=marine sediment metagenome TaxID=412755 RepID=A0A0F9MJE2_9ZZZZ
MRHDNGIVAGRLQCEIDIQESNAQLERSQGALDKTWKMLCVACGKPYMSERVPKCCVNKLKGPCCIGESK